MEQQVRDRVIPALDLSVATPDGDVVGRIGLHGSALPASVTVTLPVVTVDVNEQNPSAPASGSAGRAEGRSPLDGGRPPV